MAPSSGTEVTVGERTLSLSNLDKVLWPATGFTKGQMIDYYARVAPVMVPHLAGRAITLRRWPNGVDKNSFFEKNCPSHRPKWMPTVEMGDVNYCLVDEPAALVWTANLAAIELHPTLATAPDLDRPTFMVFDLDPGAPADILTCGQLALIIREALDHVGLQVWPKTSGSKGLQLYVPLGGTATYQETRTFAQSLTMVLERTHPDLVVSTQEKARRPGKVLIDWSQNSSFKTTVCVYSLRARDTPSASTPITWEELEGAVNDGEADALRFSPAALLERVDAHGDLMAPVLDTTQEIKLDTWDVIVIGGGPPGENAAQYAIQGSDRTAVVVEKELVGGECSYWACMPSKALLRPVEVLGAARALPGVRTDGLDVSAVLARRDEFTSHHDDAGQVSWCESVGIDVVRGRGRLAGERSVEVTASDGTTQVLHARHAVVLVTGSTADVPPVPGLREALPWISRDVTNLQEVPRRVAIVGGGVVAVESATWLHGLGAEEITIIERGPGLLAKLEPFAGEMVAAHFQEMGIRVHTATSLGRVERPGATNTGTGRIHGGPATVTAGGASFEVDEVVVAAGRIPSSTDIGLETVGLPSGGFIATDDHLTAAGEWLYAVGDVNGRALLTHMGKYQARVAGTVIAARAEGRPLDGDAPPGTGFVDRADPDAIPAVVFSDPQVASVGLTEAAARERGIDVEAITYEIGQVAGAALLRDGYEGRAKLVVNRATDTIVGATFVGPEVAELIHAATVAIVGRVTLADLWHAVPSYPTVSEIWLRLLESRS